MKITNILLSILILLLAGASAVFSYFLFEKRSQFVDGWGKMAVAINKAAAELDVDSGAGALASELTPDALGHKNYAEIDRLLPKLADRSRQIITERNVLADALCTISATVGAPADKKAMRGLDTYENGKNRVINAVNDTVNGRNRVYDRVSGIARSEFGRGLDLARMRRGDAGAVEPLKTGINSINRRKGNYESALRNIGRMVNVNSFDASDKGYARSSGNVINGVRSMVNRGRDVQRKLDAANSTIRNQQGTIDRNKREIAALKSIILEKNRQIGGYKRALGRPADDTGSTPWKDGSVEARSRLLGKVIEVHEKYGYIAIDMGKDTTVIQELGNRQLEINAGLAKGVSLVVARGDLAEKSEFIARVVLDEVGDNCSTANIAPGAQSIKVGDIVYWSASK